MAKRKLNTDFRIGLDRPQLIAAAVELGKPLLSAKKANTKTLENYIFRTTTDTKSTKIKIPEMSMRARKDIRDAASTYGTREALILLSNRFKKLTGNQNETNFMRIVAAERLSNYFTGTITSQHIDELISRLEGEFDEVVSGISKQNGNYYDEIVRDYSDELIDEQVNNLKNSN